MAEIIGPAAKKQQTVRPRVSHAKVKVRVMKDDEYESLSDGAVIFAGAVFWAFVGLLAGAWLHL
jgi:hypothetical protein